MIFAGGWPRFADGCNPPTAGSRQPGSAPASARTSRFRVLAGRLENLSPLAVLARGYAVCWNEDHSEVIRSGSRVNPGSTVHVTLHEGEIECQVLKTES